MVLHIVLRYAIPARCAISSEAGLLARRRLGNIPGEYPSLIGP